MQRGKAGEWVAWHVGGLQGLHAKIRVTLRLGIGTWTSCPRSHVRLPAIIASSTTGARCGRVSIAHTSRYVTSRTMEEELLRPLLLLIVFRFFLRSFAWYLFAIQLLAWFHSPSRSWIRGLVCDFAGAPLSSLNFFVIPTVYRWSSFNGKNVEGGRGIIFLAGSCEKSRDDSFWKILKNWFLWMQLVSENYLVEFAGCYVNYR